MNKSSVGSSSEILDIFFRLISYKRIMSISGESGTGKTTMALYLVGKYITSKRPFKDTCVWIQLSESFPKKRLETLFNSNKEIMSYIRENIFITPSKSSCSSYIEHSMVLKNLINSNVILPPNTKFIVIDNISHHLRFEISRQVQVSDSISIIDQFYDEILMPLLLFCMREEIYLILIQEVSFNIKEGEQKPFLNQLYKRLDIMHVELSKLLHNKEHQIKIYSDESQWIFNYVIEDNRILWFYY